MTSLTSLKKDMRNEKEEVQYIWHDGATIKVDLLISMSKMSGSMIVAEHNILSLYRHILIENGLGEFVKIENEVRSHYNAEAVPVRDGDDCYTRTYNKKEQVKDDKARAIYMILDYTQKVGLLNEALSIFLNDYGEILVSAISWCGFYLVVHDRLDARVNRTAFYKLAEECTPQDWPDYLRIGKNTLSNFPHYVSYEDRKEAYYDMENNPWEELCSKFWNVVKQLLLTKNLLNNE